MDIVKQLHEMGFAALEVFWLVLVIVGSYFLLHCFGVLAGKLIRPGRTTLIVGVAMILVGVSGLLFLNAPKPQKVRWAVKDGIVPGISVDRQRFLPWGGFLPWAELEPELEQRLLYQLQTEKGEAVPVRSRFKLATFEDRQNWVIEIRDPNNRLFGRLWFGSNPDREWDEDGYVRAGYALKSAAFGSPPSVVWGTFQRYTNGTYVKVSRERRKD